MLILAGLFTFITVGLHTLDLLVLPDFVQNIFFYRQDSGEQARTDDSDIYDFLSSAMAERGGFSAEFSLDYIRGIISVINTPDNLYLETVARYYIDGAVSRDAEMSLWRRENKHKYIISSGGELEELYINNGEFEFLENNITGSSRRRVSAANFSFRSVPHISDINYYLDLIELGVIIYYEISREFDGNILSIIYNIEELDQREYIQVSLETGLVLSVRTYVGGELFYANETSIIEAHFIEDTPADTAITDELFVIR